MKLLLDELGSNAICIKMLHEFSFGSEQHDRHVVSVMRLIQVLGQEYDHHVG
jgi:hypothetical protein